MTDTPTPSPPPVHESVLTHIRDLIELADAEIRTDAARLLAWIKSRI